MVALHCSAFTLPSSSLQADRTTFSKEREAMASSATVVAVGGQLTLSSPVSAAAARRGRSRVAARQCGVSSSPARLLLGARPLPQLACTGFAGVAQGPRHFSVVAKASETQVNDPDEVAADIVKSVQDAWANVDDKLAIGGLGFAALILLWASTGLIAAIDKLPLIPGFFEFVGILFSGWFTYRYLLFKPDREELLKLIDDAKGKITGQ